MLYLRVVVDVSQTLGLDNGILASEKDLLTLFSKDRTPW